MATPALGRIAGVSARGTRAIDAAREAGVSFVVHEYPTGAEPRAPGAAEPHRGYGIEAAARLGLTPGRIFKSLIVEADGRLACAVVPVSGELDLKRFAAALGVRRAVLADPVEAERTTGYVLGGISPLGQRRLLPTIVDRSAEALPTIFVSAGRRGLQIELAPAALLALTGGRYADIRRP